MIHSLRGRILRRPTVPSTVAAAAAAAVLVSAAAWPAVAQEAASPSAEPVEGADFQVYHRGRPSSFAELMASFDGADVVLVGEEHDDMVGHGVELEIYRRALDRYDIGDAAPPRTRPVVLSLEMFERDVQLVLDEYLQDLITEDHFLAGSRPWPKYETRYRPLVEEARTRRAPIVAANPPRRYVNRVSRLGPGSLDALSQEARRYLPPLPVPLPSARYRAQWDSLMSGPMERPSSREGGDAGAGKERPAHGRPADGAPPQEDPMRFAIYAQALWDAGMAHAVAGVLDSSPGALVIHMVGTFHVERGTGIPEVLPAYRPDARTLTVVMDPADDVLRIDAEQAALGEWVILTRKVDEGS